MVVAAVILGGCWSNFRGNFVFDEFESLTFPRREIINLSIHI